MANISGAERGVTFAMIPSAGDEEPEPAALGRPLLGDGDALGSERRIYVEILVGACPSGEMPWRGHHQVVESLVAHRRSESRLALERLGPGKAMPSPREKWFR